MAEPLAPRGSADRDPPDPPPHPVAVHGSEAAKRQAITELLFFASVGDLARCKGLCDGFGIDVSDARCCDYDKRTPLHLAAAEGAFSVVGWLLKKGANANAIDRFRRTPLEDAILGDHGQVAQLLQSMGGKVLDRENPIQAMALVDVSGTKLGQSVRYDDHKLWEIDAGDIEFVRKLGEGEFGEVHMGRWNGTLVAVKVLHKSDEVAMGDFRTERNVLMRTHHPHTVQFLGAVTSTMPLMIVAELMPGGSLQDLFSSQVKLSVRRQVEIALDCARGMVYLHTKKPQAVIHRDLKPANLMVGGNPYHMLGKGNRERYAHRSVVKIADFGLSKSLSMSVKKRNHAKIIAKVSERASLEAIAEEGAGAFNAEGSVSKRRGSKDRSMVGGAPDPAYEMTGETGSYRYMAPEVFRHEPYNNKVDVYAFAMIMYYLFEGCPPFFDLDPITAAKSASIDNHRPPFMQPNAHGRATPAPIVQLIKRCWDPSPSKRPEFFEVVDELEAVLRTLPDTPEGGGCCVVQ